LRCSYVATTHQAVDTESLTTVEKSQRCPSGLAIAAWSDRETASLLHIAGVHQMYLTAPSMSLRPRIYARAASLAILAIWLFLAPSAYATTYYVASTGSDSNPGTQAQPFRQV